MKSTLFFLLFLLSFSALAVTYEMCVNDVEDGESVSSDYVYCVNRNFIQIRYKYDFDRDLFNSCDNYGNFGVDQGFIDCINMNFIMVRERGFRLSYCPHYSYEHLSSSFIDCVNSNFQTLL